MRVLMRVSRTSRMMRTAFRTTKMAEEQMRAKVVRAATSNRGRVVRITDMVE